MNLSIFPHLWVNSKGPPCFSFVGEVFGENLLLPLVHSPFSQVAVPTAQTALKELKSENINPHQIRAAAEPTAKVEGQ